MLSSAKQHFIRLPLSRSLINREMPRVNRIVSYLQSFLYCIVWRTVSCVNSFQFSGIIHLESQRETRVIWGNKGTIDAGFVLTVVFAVMFDVLIWMLFFIFVSDSTELQNTLLPCSSVFIFHVCLSILSRIHPFSSRFSSFREESWALVVTRQSYTNSFSALVSLKNRQKGCNSLSHPFFLGKVTCLAVSVNWVELNAWSFSPHLEWQEWGKASMKNNPRTKLKESILGT